MPDDKPYTNAPPAGDDAEYIHIYSRADAIRDGILVDVTPTAVEAGFTVPVALTQEAWTDCVAWSDDAKGGFTGQSASGRLWDVLWMTRYAIMRHGGSDRVQVLFHRVPVDGSTTTPQPARLNAVTGPGDHGEQVITICMPHED